MTRQHAPWHFAVVSMIARPDMVLFLPCSLAGCRSVACASRYLTLVARFQRTSSLM